LFFSPYARAVALPMAGPFKFRFSVAPPTAALQTPRPLIWIEDLFC